MTVFPEKTFEKRSEINVNNMVPPLRDLLVAARQRYRFIIADGVRGKIAQEKAFATGNSKVHFGSSAHNYFPCVAGDLYPAPFSVKTPIKEFHKLQIEIILPLAKQMKIPVRFGCDWNMNGNYSDDKWDDYPHIEMHPWREWAQKLSKLYKGY